MECRELMDIIGDVKQAVEEQADKIDAIKDVVDKEVADNPDSNVEPDTGEGASEGGETPPLPEGGEPPIPPEGGEPPAEPMTPEGTKLQCHQRAENHLQNQRVIQKKKNLKPFLRTKESRK
ncbi:MAG: hypothetical protein J6P07_01900 [Spirochaetaceae bacterium]|nr:hypothetical protein [Spirochaetaceae bacterium]